MARPRLASDDRAQVLQIGAILVLGIAVLVFVTYQAVVVPQQNAAVEFQHAQTVTEALNHTRDGVIETARTGAAQPSTLPLGTGYPPRFLAVNPPQAPGRLETLPQGNVTVENTVLVSGVTVTDVFGDGREYRTRAVEYRPTYNVYADGPVVRYGASVLYQRYGEGPDAAYVVISDQRLVDGSNIYLTTLHGRLNASSPDDVTVEPRPLSAPATSVTVRSTAPDNLTIRVPTQLPEHHWAELLATETGPGGNVTADCTGTTDATPELDSDATAICDELVLVFDAGTYRLHAAAVGVGTTDSQVDAANYTVAVAGNQSYVTEESRQQLTVEVRDRYNNPVSGVTVNATVASGSGSITVDGVLTDEDGRATVVYEAPAVGTNEDNTTEEIEVAFGGTLGEQGVPPSRYGHPKDVKFEVYVQDVDSGGSGPPGFSSVGTTDLQADTAGQTQYLTFTPNATVPGATTVTIDLSAPNDDGITYSSPMVVSGGESATLDTQGQRYEVDYTAPSDGVTAGTTVNVSVQADSSGVPVGTYDVPFTREDSKVTETSSFQVQTLSGETGVSFTNAQTVGSNDAGVRFDIENGNLTGITIESITVGVSGKPKQLAEQNPGTGAFNHEVFADTSGVGSDDGYAEAGDQNDAYSLGSSISLTDTATITGQSSGTVTLNQFQGNNGAATSMAGETIEVTITYTENGQTKSYSQSIAP